MSKPVLTAGVAITCCTIGLVFTTGAGEYWLTLFDSFGATGLTFIAFTELVSVMYVYGHQKFTRDITVMTGVRPGLFWQITWRLVLLAQGELEEKRNCFWYQTFVQMEPVLS